MPALTHAPLPSYHDIFCALMHPSLPEDELAAPWRSSGDDVFWFSRSSWSLVAIAEWWKRFKGRSVVSVWLPDFICNASLIPLRYCGVQLQFYPITKELEPDYAACAAMAATAPDIFVLVHYFGQPSCTALARDFCADIGACLVEDAAHMLRPVPEMSNAGDFVIYSLHKHLPIPDGAILLVRGDGPINLSAHAIAIEILQDVCQVYLTLPRYSSHPARIWLIKRILQRVGIRSWKRSITPIGANTLADLSALGHPKMSSLAKCLLPRFLDSLDAVAQRRKQNRQAWIQVMEALYHQDTPIKPAPAKSTPYLASFVFNNASSAAAWFLKAQSVGLPVTTWPDLPPEVLGQPEVHKAAIRLRETRVYLPVHQSLRQNQITDYAAKLLASKT